MSRFRPLLTAALVATAAAALYLPDLSGSPFYVNRDEMFFGLTAHSLATTGFDTNGHYLPLYTQSPMRYGSEMWFQPALMYTAALSVKLFGLTEGTVRLPMALFGIADIVLMYLVGRQLFKRDLPAIAAAGLLAATPAHYIHSRVAMDFQAPLPFLLLWLLFALKYFDEGRRRWLVAAGVSLGVGVFTYIAAYMWMPVYAGLTLTAMIVRREPWKRHGLFAASFMIPVVSCVPFLVTHPTVIRDVMWHYDRQQPQHAGGTELFVRYFDLQRFAKAAVVYGRFWTPRFLFIDGPGGLWAAGAFLFPTAAMLVVGVIAAVRRAPAESILLLGGLFTAMIPASLVGDVDAIHRASAVIPFAILISIDGMERLRTASVPVSATAFAGMWLGLIALATSYHAELMLAQAVVRAATVPLAVAALALLLRSRTIAIGSSAFWLTAIAAIIGIQAAFVTIGFSMAAWLALEAVAVVWLIGRRAVNDMVLGLTIGLAAAIFVAAYTDSSSFSRVGPVPATVIVMSARALCAAVALGVFVAILNGLRANPLGRGPGVLVALTLAMAAVQFAYFRADYFPAPVGRTAHIVALFGAAAIPVALALTAESVTRLLSWTGNAAMAGLIAVQFGYFYSDYFTHYRAHAGHFDTEGNQRIVWEAVIDEAASREVPALYFGSVGPYGFADLYWQFYAIKHGRTDLLQRSAGELQFDAQRVVAMPPASLVVTSPSPEIDAAIQRLRESGAVDDARVLTAPDGRSTFWLLRTRTPG